MERAINISYGLAMLFLFGGALLADGLSEMPHGFAILFVIIAVGGLLVLIGNKLEDIMYARAAAELRRRKRREQWR